VTTAELILDFDPDLLDYATPKERARFVQLLDVLRHDWPSIARPSQLAPAGDWLCWLTLAGRGYGKTRQGAEWVLEEVRAGRSRRVALVGPTAADVRDVMVEGESGILSCARAGERPSHEPSKRRLTWPNGAIASLYSAEEPDRLRGPQHDLAWADELAAWKYPDTWAMLMLGLRLGRHPRVAVTTTPRPIRIIRELVAAPTTAVTRGTTYENLANLAPSFREQILARYEGTRLARQELHAEILDDVGGALWTLAELDEGRVTGDRLVDLVRVVLGVDPAATSGEDSDETGIVVAASGADGRGYVLADRSCRLSPDGWGRRAIQAAQDFRADCVVVEGNQGGEMCELVLRTAAGAMGVPMPRVKRVHAAVGKRLRAEPVAALYEQRRISHVGALPALEDQMTGYRISHVGALPALEDQMTGYTPDSGASPDRLDALVHALTELMLEPARRKLAFRGAA
jgi:phage terminase large subunit-like protein